MVGVVASTAGSDARRRDSGDAVAHPSSPSATQDLGAVRLPGFFNILGCRSQSDRRSRKLPRAIAAFAIFACGALAFAEDEVPIPGGPASARRLLALDPTRPQAAFFFDVHQALLDGAPVGEPWNKVAKRQKLDFFAEDLADWRAKFGNPALLAASGREEWKKTERALTWLGFKVGGEGRSFTTEQRDDQESLRRQTFLDALGTPTTSVLARLRAGETVTIASADETAPLPFGIASWRETLDAPKLSANTAFTDLVRDVKASRMLVALHALDPETREGLRVLLPDGKRRPVAWRILYDEVLETFARFPEALSIRDGRFLLPGGKEAEPVWTDIIGASPADRAGFLRALYKTDSGKAAYVVDVLHQLPDSAARKLLLGNTASGKAAAKRFRRLYEAIERESESYELERRVPYDFGHLARFLELSGDGDVWLSGFDLDATEYPRDESELSELLSRTRQSAGAPEETLRSLFGSETWKAPRGVSAQQRFLIVSSLLAARPNLDDPGLRLLLYRGADRFLPAYGVLEDIPIEVPQARRYLFTLDRLDRLPESRDAEVRAGLFQVNADLLAQLTRSGALIGKESGKLFSSLLDLPLFAAEDTTAEQGEEKLYRWLSDGLLSALRTSERRSIESALNEQAAREKAYREALRARDERIEARRLEARALDEFHRLEAEDRLRFFLDPFCPENDGAHGPYPPRFLREAEELRLVAGANVDSWIREALAIEQLRAALPASAAELPRVPGALPGTSAILDAAVPLPEFVAVELPEESGSPDDLLTRALVGSPPPALFDWRGGRYRFDSSADEVARRTAFREKQKLASLSDLESLHAGRDALLAASAKGNLTSAKSAAAEFFTGLDPEPARTGSRKRTEDARLARQNEEARDAAEDLARMSNAKHLSRVPERLRPLDTLLAERHLEATLGHVYAASAGDPNDIYFQDPNFVRRHAFRHAVARGRSSSSPFSQTALVPAGDGQGSRIAGSVFGLPDILGVLHSDQLPRPSGSGPANQDIRSGLMAPVRRMSGALLDDDALEFVAASCHAAEELARALGERPAQERSRGWNDVARDLVPGYRLALVADLEGAVTPELLSQYLSPSDLYRIGRRLAPSEKSALPGDQLLPSAARARDALSRLRERLGEDGARERLAQFGPRASHYAGRFRLTDLDLPAYERLAAYRTPQLLSDRLYDLKITVACTVADAGFPAAVLSLILPAALDEMIANLKMSYGSDWSSTIRRAQAFTRADLDRHLAQALETGRLARDIAADEQAAVAE